MRIAVEQLHFPRCASYGSVFADIRGFDGALQGPFEARGGSVRVQHLPAHAGERKQHLRPQVPCVRGVPNHMQRSQSSS